jgi:steroid delta-isomerase-like uncharacterized protein
MIPYKCFSQVSGDTSSIEEIKRLPKLYLEEVVNKRRLELLPQIFSKDYVSHEMSGKDTYPIKNNILKPFLISLFNAFPDLHYTIDNLIAEGDKVAVSCTARGTHKGEFFGVGATGNKVMYKEIFIFRISNGMLAEGWVVVDVAGVKEQLLKK